MGRGERPRACGAFLADGTFVPLPAVPEGLLVDYRPIEEPASLNTLELIPELLAAGVAAITIEGRQRSPAYVAQVTRTWREAIDACRANPARYAVRPAWNDALRKVFEGQQQTLGAYHRPWK